MILERRIISTYNKWTFSAVNEKLDYKRTLKTIYPTHPVYFLTSFLFQPSFSFRSLVLRWKTKRQLSGPHHVSSLHSVFIWRHKSRAVPRRKEIWHCKENVCGGRSSQLFCSLPEKFFFPVEQTNREKGQDSKVNTYLKFIKKSFHEMQLSAFSGWMKLLVSLMNHI